MMALKDEIGKRSAFSCVEEEVYLNLARTRAALEGDVAAALREEGLTESSYNSLRILRGWKGRASGGEEGTGEGGARTCGEVHREMVVRAADVTRLIDRLEKRGLVERLPEASDGRVVLVRITGEGERVVERLDGVLPGVHRGQMRGMSAAEKKELNRLLVKAREG